VGLSVTTVQLLYATSLLFGLALVAVLWQHREKRGALPLLAANVALSLWAGLRLSITIAAVTVDSVFVAIWLTRVLYLVIAATPVFTLLFALEYTGRERYFSPMVLGMLALYPLFVFGLVVVNPDWFSFYTNFEVVATTVGEEVTEYQGPAFFAHTVVGYTLTGIAFAVLGELLVRSGRPLYRGQAAALLGGIAIPLLFNALTITGNVGLDLTVVGFIPTALLFTVAIVRYDLINVTPIAREKVVQSVRDGMVVVDTDGDILDSNPAFRSLFHTDGGSLAGQSVTALFADAPALQTAYESLTESPSDGDVTADQDRTQRVTYRDRVLDIECSPIDDDRDRHVGWLFLVHDVTELVQRERDLEEQIEKLDQFAGIVSHDLRNPLNVAQGYVQHAIATGDGGQLEKSNEALNRMNDIIEDALALARESDGVTELETVSLASVVTDAWNAVETDEATFQTDDARIRADRDRLQRLLENLIRNSVEHGSTSSRTQSEDSVEHGSTSNRLETDENEHDGECDTAGHELVVSVEEGVDQLTIAVSDNGVGISDDKLEQVFEGGFTTNRSGTGLGLAIVKQIANAHGWDVTATHSESGGARFELRNVARAPTPAPRRAE